MIPTAEQVCSLLSAKHGEDLFVPECKTGSTWYGNPVRLDAWAMNRSWANMTFSGYEIKVSRSDFLKDDKWPLYLGYVHLFYFVCPWGMIQPEETPEGTGLMWVTSGGRRVITKRKAPRRKMELADALPLLLYVLMSRTSIRAARWIDHIDQEGDGREQSLLYWRDWLAKKEESRELGHRVSEVIRARVTKADDDLCLAKKLMERANSIDEILEPFGLSVASLDQWNRERAIQDALSCVPMKLIYSLERVAQEATNAANRLTEFRRESAVVSQQ